MWGLSSRDNSEIHGPVSQSHVSVLIWISSRMTLQSESLGGCHLSQMELLARSLLSCLRSLTTMLRSSQIGTRLRCVPRYREAYFLGSDVISVQQMR